MNIKVFRDKDLMFYDEPEVWIGHVHKGQYVFGTATFDKVGQTQYLITVVSRSQIAAFIEGKLSAREIAEASLSKNWALGVIVGDYDTPINITSQIDCNSVGEYLPGNAYISAAKRIEALSNIGSNFRIATGHNSSYVLRSSSQRARGYVQINGDVSFATMGSYLSTNTSLPMELNAV